MRDLVALSTLPASWINYAPPQIAGAMAEAVLPMLGCELVFVLVAANSDESQIRVMRTASAVDPRSAEHIGAALVDWVATRLSEEAAKQFSLGYSAINMKIGFEALPGEAVFHRHVESAPERVQAEDRISGDDRHLVDRVLGNQVPVDGVAERLVDTYAILIDGKADRRSGDRRRVEAAIAHVGLEVVARHVADCHARRLARQCLGDGRIVEGLDVQGSRLPTSAGTFDTSISPPPSGVVATMSKVGSTIVSARASGDRERKKDGAQRTAAPTCLASHTQGSAPLLRAKDVGVSAERDGKLFSWPARDAVRLQSTRRPCTSPRGPL